VIWVDDRAQLVTATWLAQTWQHQFQIVFKAMLRSDDIVATVSTTSVATLIATAEWVLNGAVMMALGRTIALVLMAVVTAASISLRHDDRRRADHRY
jgi:hypothetical protein